MGMKEWRGPRHKKVTLEIKSQMQKLRETGRTLQDIAEHFGVTMSTVRYHVVFGDKEKVVARSIENQRKRILNETPEEREKRIIHRREYMREYMNSRYHDDPEFRQRVLGHVKKYDRRVRGSDTTASEENGLD